MWFIGVEVEQETSAPPPKKNPGSAPARGTRKCLFRSQISSKIFGKKYSSPCNFEKTLVPLGGPNRCKFYSAA